MSYELYKIVNDRLRLLNLSISVAESLTSGLIQSGITEISGSTSIFIGGATVYSLESKVELLGVEKTHAESVNCVSEKVAQEMAIGICKLFKSDVGISTTGYAEPDDTWNILTPYAYIGIKYPNDIKVKKISAPNMGRNEVRRKIAKDALSFLLDVLQ